MTDKKTQGKMMREERLTIYTKMELMQLDTNGKEHTKSKYRKTMKDTKNKGQPIQWMNKIAITVSIREYVERKRECKFCTAPGWTPIDNSPQKK